MVCKSAAQDPYAVCPFSDYSDVDPDSNVDPDRQHTPVDHIPPWLRSGIKVGSQLANILI